MYSAEKTKTKPSDAGIIQGAVHYEIQKILIFCIIFLWCKILSANINCFKKLSFVVSTVIRWGEQKRIISGDATELSRFSHLKGVLPSLPK